MGEWLFKNDTWAELAVRLGFFGYLLAAVGASLIDKLDQVIPTDAAQFVGSIIIALLLFLPWYLGLKPRDVHFSKFAVIMAGAYGLIGSLYLLHLLGLHPFANAPIAKSYDTLTDVLGSLVFVAGWHNLSQFNPEPSDVRSERVIIILLTFVLVACGVWKGWVEAVANPSAESVAAARLLLNACNGAIFLSLYIQMRRLLQFPDPLTHLLIVLFGCAQIAASGRDCLSDVQQCAASTAQGIAAYSIAWMLLAGKIAFGVYVLFLYYNGTIGSEFLDKGSKANGGSV